MENNNDGIINTTCSSHCGGTCILKVHVKNGTIIKIETDDSTEELQLRACLRGRAYRYRVYAPDRLLYPMRRVGVRGGANFKRISWDEAIDTVASEILRVRDTYSPASILYLFMAGDDHKINHASQMAKVLALAGGYTRAWGVASFAGGMYAQQVTYGTHYTSNTRDDLINSRLIIMWGWNPAITVAGTNTMWYLIKARDAGAKIVVVDPRYTNSAAVLAHRWIPIRPGTDGAMLLAMAYVMIHEDLHNQIFLDKYTIGFDKFKNYVIGIEDGIAKTPEWAASITGVAVKSIENLARQYATIKPAALIAGIAPGRTAYGEQYHRIAITLAAMTGNVGIHGGDAAGRAWEGFTPFGGYPYEESRTYDRDDITNPVDELTPIPPKLSPIGYRASRVHRVDIPDFIEKGKSGGFLADCRLIAITNCSYVNSFPDINRIVRALKSKDLEFIFIQEQFMTPTAKFADIILPTNTFMERNDFTLGTGMPYYGCINKVIDSLGESKSPFEIASLLASRLGLHNFSNSTEEDHIKEAARNNAIPDYNKFRRQGVYRICLKEPYVAFQKQIEDPLNNPFPTPSGMIEIYSQQCADLNQHTKIPPIPKYIETWENRNDPLAARYPLQLVTTHFKTRANAQFDNISFLKELEHQFISINSADAKAREIIDGDVVKVFNDRGSMIIKAKITERIMPGVVDIPHGAWYAPDANGVDRGGCPNVLTKAIMSPGGAYTFNTCLVQVEKA